MLTCGLGTFLATEIRQRKHCDLVKTLNQIDHPTLKNCIEPNCTDRATRQKQLRTVQFFCDNVSEWTMWCGYLAQDRGNISKAIKCLEGRSHDAFETSCEVVESAEKSKAIRRARSVQSTIGSACGQRLGWRHHNASNDCVERSTFAQSQVHKT